ncbi:MAG: DUF922 domain-containing protein [Candidatus Micrarchaeota archaeon]
MKLYLLGAVLVILFLYGCVNLCNQPPVIINNCTNQPVQPCNCPEQNCSSIQQNDTPTQPQNISPTQSPQSPLSSLMSAPANYPLLTVPTKTYVDDVRVIDLATYEAPIGRALVVGSEYEIIAENNQPFTDYVQFTVYVDNEPIESFNATCPENCASPTMYSVPLFILEGEYNEIKVTVEDGAGLIGESMVYAYALSESDAYYLAETCSLSAEVGDLCGEVDSGVLTFYGSTISDGWAHDSNPVPYNLNNNYSDLCDEVNSGGGLGTGFFAQTRCRYRQNFCSSFTPVPDQQSCTCNCTASVTSVTVTPEINIDFPDWTNYDSGTTCEKQHWDTFLQNTKTHEEGHALRCQDTSNSIKAGALPLTNQATGATCQAACDAAFEKLKTDVQTELTNEINALNAENALYDSTTGHGTTQGAVLDCGAC